MDKFLLNYFMLWELLKHFMFSSKGMDISFDIS